MENETWTLYSINQQLFELLSDRNEYDEDSFRDTFEALALERVQKIDNTCSFIKHRRAQAEALKAEAKALKERADSYANQAENASNWLSKLLEPREKFENSRHKIQWRKSTKVEISLDIKPDSLPAEYLKTTVAPNKLAITEALKEGREVPHCKLVEQLNMSVK